jgi:hypothetical protein
MMDKKVQKRYVDHSLGFPVILLNAPLIKVRGQWALHLNYNDYQVAVLQNLARKPTRLTGNEIHFIRTYFEMTIRDFAEQVSVKHPAVIKWESKADTPTQMAWSTEKDIRLFVLDEIAQKASELRDLYRSLKNAASASAKPIVVNGDDLAA